MTVAFVWAGAACAQDTGFTGFSPPSSDFSDSYDAPASDESYVADPSESFVVEHSGDVATAAPRAVIQAERAPTEERCREYTTDGRASGRGVACPQEDGTWRIVTGPDAVTRLAPESFAVRAPGRDDPDYARDMRDDGEDARRSRRFRLDWNAWSADRRGNTARADRYRYDE